MFIIIWWGGMNGRVLSLKYVPNHWTLPIIWKSVSNPYLVLIIRGSSNLHLTHPKISFFKKSAMVQIQDKGNLYPLYRSLIICWESEICNPFGWFVVIDKGSGEPWFNPTPRYSIVSNDLIKVSSRVETDTFWPDMGYPVDC